jgi:hypothetical protein
MRAAGILEWRGLEFKMRINDLQAVKQNQLKQYFE